MRLFRIAVVLAAGLWHVAAIAQSPSPKATFDTLYLPFRHLGIEDGLSQGLVGSIVQDRAGFMWFATKDGLNRYDGYSFRVFRNDPEDSTSIRDNHIMAVWEDRAGLLWVGANSGLDVFDPATEVFHHFSCGDRPSGTGGFRSLGPKQCATNLITEDPAGHLWVTAGEGLYRITPDRASTITGPGTRVELVGENKGMHFNWMEVDERGVLRATWATPTGYSENYGIRTFTINTLDETRIASMIAAPHSMTWGPILALQGEEDWAAFACDTVRKLTYLFDADRLEVHDDSRDDLRTVPLVGTDWVNVYQATTDINGTIWACGLGVWQCDPRTGRVSRLMSASADLEITDVGVVRVYRDRSGVMWMGMNGYGVLMYDPRAERFHTRPTSSLRAMIPLRDGRVLGFTYAGLYYVIGEDRSITSIPIVQESETDPFTTSGETYVVEEGRGVLWSNPADPRKRSLVLARHDERSGSMERYADPDVPVRFPLHIGHDTLISFGSLSAFGQFNIRTKRYKSIPYPIAADGGLYEFVQAICLDGEDIFWLGTMKGLLRLDPRTKEWAHYANDPNHAHSLSADVIFCLLNDPEDANILWVGTNGGGLNRLDKRTGQFTRFNSGNGLPNDVIYGLLADDDGLLWMSTNKGIARFDPRTHEVRSFDASDGLQGDEYNRYAFCKAANGELFFGGVNGFNRFRPKELRTDTLPVQVCITDIRSMNRSIAFGAEGSPLTQPAHLTRELVIPYREAGMLTFHFASMDYGAVLNRQYQYQLDGFDPERINAGLKRSATFTNLDPGEYTFKVWGRNRDGVWNEVPTTLRLSILPPWYLTTWTKALTLLLVLGSIMAYNRLRTRSLRRQRDKLERQVQERTGELNRAVQRSDELLHNILPEEVAAELKSKGEAEAKLIDQVTVLFTDFSGFTAMSEQVTPRELVHDLNECFSAFDRITEKHGIEKIKTIGDAYMAAGGLPTPNTTHATDVINAALDMRDFIAEGKARKVAAGLPYFEIRIGIHTGPVVAGIVGVKKFQYDIWGDTVNIASRMESSGEVGQVNISEATYRLVVGYQLSVAGRTDPNAEAGSDGQPTTGNKQLFKFTPRGKVQAKGKGEMEMYFVRCSSEGAKENFVSLS